jgi:hypothetical protein
VGSVYELAFPSYASTFVAEELAPGSLAHYQLLEPKGFAKPH